MLHQLFGLGYTVAQLYLIQISVALWRYAVLRYDEKGSVAANADLFTSYHDTYCPRGKSRKNPRICGVIYG